MYPCKKDVCAPKYIILILPENMFNNTYVKYVKYAKYQFPHTKH